MRYMGSPAMVQSITLVIIARTRVPFEKIWVTAYLTWGVVTEERYSGLSWFSVWVVKETAVGVKFSGYMFILSVIIPIWGRRGYSVSHVVLGLLKTVSFNGRLSFEIWVEIQGRGEVGLVVLKGYGEDLEWNINIEQKGLFWMRHGWFVGRGIIDEILIEVSHLKDHDLGFIGDRCNYKWKGFSYIGECGFKHFSGVNWIVVSDRDCSVAWYINKYGHWVLRRRVWDSGSDIQGMRAFRRRRENGVIGHRRGIIFVGHKGLMEIEGGS